MDDDLKRIESIEKRLLLVEQLLDTVLKTLVDVVLKSTDENDVLGDRNT